MRLIALLFLLQSSMATVRDEGPLSTDDVHQIRQRLIRSLGLTRVPDITQVNITEEEKAEAYRLYYARLKEKENQENDEEDDEEEEEEIEVEEKILTFNASVKHIEPESDKKFPIQLRIPVDIPQEDLTINTQPTTVLHIYKRQEATSGLFNSRLLAYPPVVTLLVYQLLSNNSQERLLIASHRIVFNDKQWQSVGVNVSYNNNESNIVLQLECDTCNMYGFNIDKQATLNIYLSTHQTNSLVRSRRSSKHKLSKKIKAHQSEIFVDHPRSGTIDCNKESRRKCCRHRMYVNFTHLRMDFVIEPKGFEAYYCKGKCPRLYNPAHAHALIQSTMNAQGKNVKIPKPCCAPSKLSNLSIIHLDEHLKLKVTDWTNAVVEECACS